MTTPAKRTQNWLPGIFNDFFGNEWIAKTSAAAPALNIVETDKEYIVELLYEKKSLQRQYEWLENLKEQKQLPNVTAETCWISVKNGYKWECGRSGMDNTPRGKKGERAEKERDFKIC